MKFGEYLKRQRERRDWTQPKAASEIGIEQSYLSKLETGRSSPSEDVFDRLAGAYDLDVMAMTDDIDDAELKNLKEIKTVRNAILERQHSRVKLGRRWLVAGALMLMAGAGMIGAAMIPGHAEAQYLYRSAGILGIDEDLDAYDVVNLNMQRADSGSVDDNRRKNMLARLDPVDLTSHQFRGDAFIEPVTSGTRRYYELIDRWEVEPDTGIRWLLVPGLMLLAGAAACLYVGRHWK